MFGKRKNPPTASPNASPPAPLPSTPLPLEARPEAAGAAGERQPVTEDPGALTAESAPQTNSPSGLKSPAPRRPEPRVPAAPSAVEGRKLVVGREICLSGEIKTCETLVVEGRVEADLNDSQSLEISEPGLFKGQAIVEECIVHGTFEGDLTVTGRLVIHPGGRVIGKIRYADIEILKGGRLSGDVDVLEASFRARLQGEGPKLAHSSDAAPNGDASQSQAG
ncbi:MAG TPA: polymer-forming cytoskeletal protein [Kiloniellaceae bacterium]|nr:polymer-forming cytoskeletal protein [Kiloniellaceae bacterium]HIP79812.1 polymer-forming cytoskeletal protein [Kiloniellaceae bacterium]